MISRHVFESPIMEMISKCVSGVIMGPMDQYSNVIKSEFMNAVDWMYYALRSSPSTTTFCH